MMKKYTSTLLALLLAGTFIGCGSSNDTKVKEDTNTSTPDVPKEEITPPVQEQTQKMPTCYIKEGTPKTDSSLVVHAKCKDGNIPIDEAKVTLDNTVKSVDYKGVYFSDFIGFNNLQPSTTYKAILEVVVGGKTIKESVKIKTQEEKVEVTPTPTPTPTPIVDTPPSNNPPKWTKDFYDTHVLITDDEKNNFIMNLRSEALVEPMQELIFVIKKINLESYEDNPNITYKGLIKIENGILKFSGYSMGTGSRESVIVTISAISNNKSSDTKVKFDFLLPTL